MKHCKPGIFCFLFIVFFAVISAGAQTSHKIKFGTIPVLQSLPLFVASEKGFFKDQGLDVEVILFNSAMEKDIAFTSGQLAGYFGDLMTPAVLAANGTKIKMVATNFNTTADQRMFAILASPKAKQKDAAAIAKAGIAAGSNAIPEFLIVRLLSAKKIPRESIKFIDIKSIPIRLQMLLSGQVAGALLPEPLATLAETKGAKSLADDRGLGISATVLAFSADFLKTNPESAKKFLAAVDKASVYINKNPDEVRGIMNKSCKMPESLQRSFPIPKFPRLSVPDEAQVMDVYKWLKGKKIVKTDLSYTDLVADGYVR
ncbi:MAG: ABC transporter substrate-binding protein [Syntrophorhabdaceae bacterium]